jgi:hypothetical protein
MKQFDIKPFSGKVRTSLCAEDIVLRNRQALVEFGMVEVHYLMEDDESTSYLLFKFGFKVPYFNLFYAKKISSHTDKYLTESIIRLLYLNPGNKNTVIHIKSITSFILSNFSSTKKKASAVKDGKFIDVPVLDYDKVYSLVWLIDSRDLVSSYTPDTEKLVMYGRNCSISKNLKISINSKHRSQAAVSYYESAIHNAAELLHESQELVKITDSRIQRTELVKSKNRNVSTRTITRYMAPRTRSMIKELNLVKPFKSHNSFLKYEEFLLLQTSSAEILAQKLSVSKSTIFEFRKINNQ